jgi:hypothetical protein
MGRIQHKGTKNTKILRRSRGDQAKEGYNEAVRQ